MDPVDHIAGIDTMGKILPFITAFARALDEVPDVKIEPIIKKPFVGDVFHVNANRSGSFHLKKENEIHIFYCKQTGRIYHSSDENANRKLKLLTVLFTLHLIVRAF
jgi:hypothetical protein